MSKSVKLKLNVDLHGLRAGQMITLYVDKNGTILDRQWRRRLKDSAIDNCVEVMSSKSLTASRKDNK